MTLSFVEMLAALPQAGAAPQANGPGAGGPLDAGLFLQAMAEARELASQELAAAAMLGTVLASQTTQPASAAGGPVAAEDAGGDAGAEAVEFSTEHVTLKLLEAQLALLLGIQAGAAHVPGRNTAAPNAATPDPATEPGGMDAFPPPVTPARAVADVLVLLARAVAGETAHPNAVPEAVSQGFGAPIAGRETPVVQQPPDSLATVMACAGGNPPQPGRAMPEAAPKAQPGSVVPASEAAVESTGAQAPVLPEQYAAAPVAAEGSAEPLPEEAVLAVKTLRWAVRATVTQRGRASPQQERAALASPESSATAARVSSGSDPAVAAISMEGGRLESLPGPRPAGADTFLGNHQPLRETAFRALADQAVRNVRILAGSGETSLTVRLVPESLGEMRIEVHATGDGLAVRMASASPAVRGALEAQAQSLRDALQRDGVDVSHIEVAADLARQGGQRPADDGKAQRPFLLNRPDTAYRGWRYERAADDASPLRRASRHQGMVDLFV
ncbi:MAG: flagellar hook-length control protein FliK [Candidatus Hydrogenedentes bacterium]|nr:flagellar hook-length control protein FliK [Candidatus Hydrogenedentota bacterium]